MTDKKVGVSLKQQDIIKKAKVFKDLNTYTFLKETQPDGRDYYYAGFILEVYENYLVLFDVQVLTEIPIMIDKIGMLEIAKDRRLSKEDALKLLNEHIKDGNK